jgi:hypothetical protein
MPKSMGGLSADGGGSSEIIDLPIVEHRTQSDSSGAPTPAGPTPTSAPAFVPWNEFLQSASSQDVKNRFAKEVGEILNQHGLGGVCCLALIEPVDSIDTYDLDKIYAALMNNNPAHAKDVVLFLLSTGGAGEPAYQISKICKFFSNSSFKVIVPRIAKSAATLIAIGADEIHMSLLGQLGPIDPQIDGLPALGVSSALRTIASVAEQYPRSAEMFSRYLRSALTVEQIGYCDRISESAVQYAERLLSTKPNLAPRALTIAKELVHEYKDHGFVIDLDEAQKHLGSDWVKTGTVEIKAAEAIYSLFESVNLWYGISRSKRMLVTGLAASPESVLIFNRKQN